MKVDGSVATHATIGGTDDDGEAVWWRLATPCLRGVGHGVTQEGGAVSHGGVIKVTG